MRGKRQASAPAPGEPARNVRVAVTENHHGEGMIYTHSSPTALRCEISGSTSKGSLDVRIKIIFLPTCNAMSASPSFRPPRALLPRAKVEQLVVATSSNEREEEALALLFARRFSSDSSALTTDQQHKLDHRKLNHSVLSHSVRNKSSITATAMTARTAMAESAKSSAAAASPPPASSSSGPAKKGKKGRPKKAGPTEPKVKRTSTPPKVD